MLTGSTKRRGRRTLMVQGAVRLLQALLLTPQTRLLLVRRESRSARKRAMYNPSGKESEPFEIKHRRLQHLVHRRLHHHLQYRLRHRLKSLRSERGGDPHLRHRRHRPNRPNPRRLHLCELILLCDCLFHDTDHPLQLLPRDQPRNCRKKCRP